MKEKFKKNAEHRTQNSEYPHKGNPGDLRMEKLSFFSTNKFGGIRPILRNQNS